MTTVGGSAGMVPSGRGTPGALGFCVGSNTSERRAGGGGSRWRRRRGGEQWVRPGRTTGTAAATEGIGGPAEGAAPPSRRRIWDFELLVAILQLLDRAGHLADLALQPLDAQHLLSGRRCALPGRVLGCSAALPPEQPLEHRSPSCADARVGAIKATARAAARNVRDIRPRIMTDRAVAPRLRISIPTRSRPKCDYGHGANANPRRSRRGLRCGFRLERGHQEVTPSTVTARRFCDQHDMSLQIATGRSLP